MPPRRPPVPCDDEAVARRLDLGAEPAQPLDDGGDPVGLLDAQLLGAADHRRRPRRSSRAARRAAARRSPAGPRRPRPRCPRAGRGRRRGRRRARATLGVPAGSSSPARSARPCARGCAGSPVRVQLTPTLPQHDREPGTSTRGGEQEGGRGQVAGDRELARARARRRQRTVHGHRPSRRVTGTPARGEHPLGVVAARHGLDHRRGSPGQAREQHAGLDLGARRRAARTRCREPRARGR